MNIWNSFPEEKISGERFFAVIEISSGSKNKYELDKDTGLLRLKRVQYTSTRYPLNYGFIPKTLADDGDPLDALVLCREEVLPMTLIECYPIGVLKMTEGSASDEKIIAIPFADKTLTDYKDITELPHNRYEEIMRFFSVYKALEGKENSVDNIYNRAEAVRIINECKGRYKALSMHDL